MEEGMERILELARRSSCECEVYGESNRLFGVDMHRGAVESIERAHGTGLAVRLVRDGRIGLAYTSDVTPEGCRRAFEEAHVNAASGTPVAFDALADDRRARERGNLYPVLPPTGGDHDRVKQVRAMENACFGFDASVENTEGACYRDVCGDIFVASTRGFHRRETRGFCSCAVTAVARRGSEVRSGSYYAQALQPADIDFVAVGERAAARAVRLLGSRRIATGRYPVLIDGAAFIDIVEFLAEALSAEMVVKGMSLFAGKDGTSVARDVVSVVDDPFRAGCCFKASFDDEGVPKERRTLIGSGVLESYLHNAYSSRRMGLKPAGNAVRHTYRSPPLPGPSNLYLAPGARSGDEMIAEMDEGVYVQDIMGIHTADTISGDFSVGISGFHVRGGTADEPVGEMTMSGNILRLLCGIREVGRDLVFIGPYGSPTVSIENVSISGT